MANWSYDGMVWHLRSDCASMTRCFVSDGGAFEKIRGGARPVEDPARHHARLTLDNKFDALDVEHS